MKLIYNFDIVHAHSTYPNGFTAAKLKKLYNFPLIITPHGEDIHIAPEINFGLRLDSEQDRKIKSALNSANYTTAISQSVAESIRSTGLIENKIVPISNGVDLARFRKTQTVDVYRFLGIPTDSQLVISVGNYHPRKGHEVLIESIRLAIEVNPKIRLVIIGRTSDKLVAKVEKLGLKEYIQFTGSLDFPIDQINTDEPDMLVALMQTALVYITASVDEGSEGLSLALLESMSAGLCVIATDVSGNRDIIDNGKNGVIIPPSSPEAMANAMLETLLDDEMRKKLLNKSIEVVNKFSWLEISKKYISLYQKALNEAAL